MSIRPTDFLDIDSSLSDEERDIRDTVRAFVQDRIVACVGEWFEEARVPRELAPELGKLGVLGMHLEGYGCAGTSATAYGLACMELEAGDSGLRSMVSVQGSLAMFAIHHWGSEEQKQEWLPRMAAGEAIGCFGLTEPDAGSDPSAMRTRARRDGHVGHAAVGDPHLRAVQDPVVTVPAGPGPHGRRVAAGVRLGQAEAADGLARRHAGQPLLLLLLAPVGVDREHGQ